MAKSSIRDQQDEAKTAEADKKPRPFACWGCGGLGHSLRTCSKRTIRGNEALKKEVADQKRKIAEVQMAKNSVRDQQDEAKAAEADKSPRPFACWGCGELETKRSTEERGGRSEEENSRGANGEELHPGSARRSEDGRSRQEDKTVRLLGMRRIRPFAEDLFKEDDAGKEAVLGGPQ